MKLSKYIVKFEVVSENQSTNRIIGIDTILGNFPNEIESDSPIDLFFSEQLIFAGVLYTISNTKSEISLKDDELCHIKHITLSIPDDGVDPYYDPETFDFCDFL